MTHEPAEIADMRKLYAVVRGDLPRGLQAAQAGHAIADLILAYPDAADTWRNDPNGNYLIVLDVRDLAELREEQRRIALSDIPTRAFLEPDLGNEMTAFAAFPPPDRNHLFEGFDLAYSRRRWAPRLKRHFGTQ